MGQLRDERGLYAKIFAVADNGEEEDLIAGLVGAVRPAVVLGLNVLAELGHGGLSVAPAGSPRGGKTA